MALKWTMDALWAAVAVGATVVGGVYTTVYHSGVSASELASVKDHQREQDKKLDANADLSARVDQKLDDAIDRLDRIEKKIDDDHR